MNELSGMQKFIKLFVSEATFTAMEAESKEWIMKCPHCNDEHSIWNMGGVRYKAAGNPRMYRFCPNCGQRSWQTVSKKQ